MNAPPFSPALRFQQRQKAEREQQAFYEALKAQSAPVIDPTTTDYNAFEQLRMALEKDVHYVKGLGKGEEKREHIRNRLIPQYEPHLKAYCDQDEVYANPIMVWMIVWYFDAGDIQKAFEVGLLAIEQKQQTPFKRDLPTFFVDELKAWAESTNTLEEKQQAMYYLLKAVDQVRDWPLKDEVKLKYLVVLGNLFYDLGDAENQQKALSLYCEAQKYGNPKRKTRINELTKLYGSLPTEGTLVSLTQDRDLADQDTQGSPSTFNGSEEETSNDPEDKS